jgi:3-oxoacyl-[acyl-carrier-protein] synthase-1
MTTCSLAALGMVNGLGNDCDVIWRRTLAGDQSAFRPRPDLAAGRGEPVAAVDDDALPKIPAGLARYACRNNAFSLAALEQIEDAVRDAIRAVGADRVGVVMGTSTSGSRECEAAILHHYAHGRLLPEFCYEQLELGGAAGFLADLLDLRGPALAISTACSSGARALASARSLLALDVCDVVLAGGSDSLCGLTTHGFASLKAVAPGVTNPFSANRAGLSLGEGAALFLVTRDAGGVQLLGVGESSEAHHISSPDPDGRGAAASMRGALADAGLAPSAVRYLNLHGTGTRQNDAMESLAVADVLGDATPCSSTKPLVGHCLGAAGAIELAFCWLALKAWAGDAPQAGLPLPPHVYDGVPDPELATLRLAGAGETARCASGDAPVLMTNSFGFGGNNCTLVVGETRA